MYIDRVLNKKLNYLLLAWKFYIILIMKLFRSIYMWNIVNNLQSSCQSCRSISRLTTYLPTYFLFNYLLTLWSRFLPGKLSGPQLFKKFLTFYGIRNFITGFQRFRSSSNSSTYAVQSKMSPCNAAFLWVNLLSDLEKNHTKYSS